VTFRYKFILVLTQAPAHANWGIGARVAADPWKGWFRQKRQLGTPRDQGPARLLENDCQFGLLSADCMPRREGMVVIKQFSGERYCFKVPKLPVYFMTTSLTHTSIQTHAHNHMLRHVNAHTVIGTYTIFCEENDLC
jgi:hypothetical protein